MADRDPAVVDDAELARRQLESQLAIFEAQLAGGRGSRVRRPVADVLATVCPRAPERSLPNGVLYRDAAALTDAVLDELQATYAAAGVRAWTVWVRPGDEPLAQRLAARGHVHDAEPMLMAATMDELALGAEQPDLDLDPEPRWRDVAALNDAAYGLDGEVAAMLDGIDDPLARRRPRRRLHHRLARGHGHGGAGLPRARLPLARTLRDVGAEGVTNLCRHPGRRRSRR